MTYRNMRLNSSMRSLERKLEGLKDTTKARMLSDRGEGAERMYADLDRSEAVQDGENAAAEAERDREQALLGAILRLNVCGGERLVRTFLLIVENGKDRDSSIERLTTRRRRWNIAKVLYFRHRKQLLRFFDVTRLHTEM